MAAAALLLIFTSCSGEIQTPGEALRIFGDSLPQAYLGEQYEAQVRAVGGLRPFTYQLQEGELPPGLSLEAGVISGVPTETGSFDFTITVSDANLSRTFEEYSLTIIERPPPMLELIAPQTEIRTPVTVRLQVANASQLRAFTTLLAWDAEQFELVEGSVEATVAGAAIVSRREPGSLHLEMAALGEPWNGELELAQFTLAPTRPAVLRPSLEALFLGDLGTRHFQGAEPGSGPTPVESGSAPGTGGEAESTADGTDDDAADVTGDETSVETSDETSDETGDESSDETGDATNDETSDEVGDANGDASEGDEAR